MGTAARVAKTYLRKQNPRLELKMWALDGGRGVEESQQ